MGCGESRIVPELDEGSSAPCTINMKQLKNSFKKPGSFKKDTNVRFQVDLEILGKDDIESENIQQSVDSGSSSNAIKEEEVHKTEENKIKQKKIYFQKTSSKCNEIEENKTAPNDVLLPHVNHPPQLQEDSQVVCLGSLPIKSRKSEELMIATSEIIQKEEQISKLKAENERLKNVACNSKTVTGKPHAT